MSALPQPTRPLVVPPAPWGFPLPVESRLDNGLRVLAHDVRGQYVLSLRLVVPLRLAVEERRVEGVAAMTARLLDEGTARHGSEEFASLLERHGIAYGSGVSDGALHVDLDVPHRFLVPALGLLRELLAEPVFPEDEVARILRTRLAEIEQERASGAHRAARELLATMWAPQDRASRPTAGSPETVAAMTRTDIADFHARHVGPAGATLVVAGDLGGLDLPEVVDAALADWSAPGHQPVPAPVAPVPAADAARVVVVDRPGAVQSELSVGRPGPDRHVAGGWAPYPVLSFVLGGSPNARVDAVLREEKGYTYGIRTSFRPRTRGGSVVTAGSVRADVTGESLGLLVDILDSARAGFTDDEARAGADYVARTAPGRFATADAIAEEAAALAAEGLSPEFPTQMLRAVGDLDAQALTTAYRGVVDGGWSVVVVGDAEQCVAGIEAAGLGPVTVVPA
ncbi:MAG TPA: pitrilysin family protein [Dermatophilaceae bacterium]|nr:pitrilysin family protein [Dermatophilaceae bacterium]